MTINVLEPLSAFPYEQNIELHKLYKHYKKKLRIDSQYVYKRIIDKAIEDKDNQGKNKTELFNESNAGQVLLNLVRFMMVSDESSHEQIFGHFLDSQRTKP